MMEHPRPQGEVTATARSNHIGEIATETFCLSSLSSACYYFTPAVLYMYAGFVEQTIDPLSDWAAENDATPIYREQFSKPLFAGLGPWDFILYGVQKPHWNSLREFLSGVCGADTPAKHYFETFYTTVHIPDPVLVARHGKKDDPRRVEVTIFCLSTNRCRLQLQEPVGLTPTIVTRPATTQVIERARSIFKEDLSTLSHRITQPNQALVNEIASLPIVVNRQLPNQTPRGE